MEEEQREEAVLQDMNPILEIEILDAEEDRILQVQREENALALLFLMTKTTETEVEVEAEIEAEVEIEVEREAEVEAEAEREETETEVEVEKEEVARGVETEAEIEEPRIEKTEANHQLVALVPNHQWILLQNPMTNKQVATAAILKTTMKIILTQEKREHLLVVHKNKHVSSFIWTNNIAGNVEKRLGLQRTTRPHFLEWFCDCIL